MITNYNFRYSNFFGNDENVLAINQQRHNIEHDVV